MIFNESCFFRSSESGERAGEHATRLATKTHPLLTFHLPPVSYLAPYLWSSSINFYILKQIGLYLGKEWCPAQKLSSFLVKIVENEINAINTQTTTNDTIVLSSLGSALRILRKWQIIFPEKCEYKQNLEYNFKEDRRWKMLFWKRVWGLSPVSLLFSLEPQTVRFCPHYFHQKCPCQAHQRLGQWSCESCAHMITPLLLEKVSSSLGFKDPTFSCACWTAVISDPCLQILQTEFCIDNV